MLVLSNEWLEELFSRKSSSNHTRQMIKQIAVLTKCVEQHVISESTQPM